MRPIRDGLYGPVLAGVRNAFNNDNLWVERFMGDPELRGCPNCWRAEAVKGDARTGAYVIDIPVWKADVARWQ